MRGWRCLMSIPVLVSILTVVALAVVAVAKLSSKYSSLSRNPLFARANGQ